MTYKINTPHAAIIIWNYADRIDSSGAKSNRLQLIEQKIISTTSCINITTSKAKGDPQGSFNFVLAPTKNWTSAITPGSWCVILMSSEPITEKDLSIADKNKVKMLGKIETVRLQTSATADGARQSHYFVSGVDWGHVFHNNIYIDPSIENNTVAKDQTSGFYTAMISELFGKGYVPERRSINANIATLLNICGKALSGFTKNQADSGRVAKSIYNFTLPKEVLSYFSFRDKNNTKSTKNSINELLTLISGKLIKSDNKENYDNLSAYKVTYEATGFIDIYALQGSFSLIQLLLDNNNSALNEMYSEFRWNSKDNGLRLCLYNRIRPFVYSSKFKSSLSSYFKNLHFHDIDPMRVKSLNAGTNWRDKVNFIMITPNFSDFVVEQNIIMKNVETLDQVSFEREGLRMMTIPCKHMPAVGTSNTIESVDYSGWLPLLRQWYFNTHKLLNGTIELIGDSKYIAVGDNIKFSSELLSPTPNYNRDSRSQGKHYFVLAHVESVTNSFSVSPNGARTFSTTINFSRGILVTDKLENVGEGSLDNDTHNAKGIKRTDHNDHVFATAENDDPDPQKLKGQ